MSVCFTGHRPQNLPWGFDETHIQCSQLKNRIHTIISKLCEQHNQMSFISGMGLGVDTWAAEIVLSLKKQHSDIILEAAVPFTLQMERWTLEAQNRYFSILDRCDRVHFMRNEHDIAYRYFNRSAIWQRNYFMVDRSDYVVAMWDFNKKGGGTFGTIEYAMSKNKAIILINPVTLKIHVRKVKVGSLDDQEN